MEHRFRLSRFLCISSGCTSGALAGVLCGGPSLSQRDRDLRATSSWRISVAAASGPLLPCASFLGRARAWQGPGAHLVRVWQLPRLAWLGLALISAQCALRRRAIRRGFFRASFLWRLSAAATSGLMNHVSPPGQVPLYDDACGLFPLRLC